MISLLGGLGSEDRSAEQAQSTYIIGRGGEMYKRESIREIIIPVGSKREATGIIESLLRLVYDPEEFKATYGHFYDEEGVNLALLCQFTHEFRADFFESNYPDAPPGSGQVLITPGLVPVLSEEVIRLVNEQGWAKREVPEWFDLEIVTMHVGYEAEQPNVLKDQAPPPQNGILSRLISILRRA